MQVRAEDLSSHLASRLAPLYFITGDETLLVQEACDAVLAAARQQGYSERTVLQVERGFNWGEVTHSAASMSLFAEKRVLDLRLADIKVDKDGSAVLREYAANPPPDTLMLLRCPRMTKRQLDGAWAKAMAGAGVLVQVWGVDIGQLPRWLQNRLRAAGLSLTPDALAYFAERVEGNLLAAVQEVAKLKLSALPSPIDLPSLMAVLEDASHYDVFELLDAILRGDAARIARMVPGLQAEGVSVFAVMGAMSSQFRAMISGARIPAPPQRLKLIDGFKRRHGKASLMDALAEMALIDSQGKGVLLGSEWQALENLCLRLAADPKKTGTSMPSLHSQLAHVRR